MHVPDSLARAFESEFEKQIAAFAHQQNLISHSEELKSVRFLKRSVVPHVMRLSSLFNRQEQEQGEGLDPYWKKSSRPAHLRLAYFLYFMPSNLFRVASIWSELHRLGYEWPQATNLSRSSLQAIEFGAGPATGACGIAAGETYAPMGLPSNGTWALIEQDRAILELGAQWASTYFASLKKENWSLRAFHRKIDLKQGFLPPTAPRFNLWLMSFYLNETQDSPELLGKRLLQAWDQHLSDDSLIILIEPALKQQSRRLLELRKALLQETAQMESLGLKVLLPCLGHQACHALANPEDWCHEDVSWWRPSYFKTIDRLAGLDRKSLPFSYLVIAKSKKSREELLPALARQNENTRYRLVSPAHSEGQDLEFFICGQDGKRRTRYRPTKKQAQEQDLDRGDILINTQVRGDAQASRIESCQILTKK